MSHLRYQTLNSATRAATKLEALLTMSRALAGTSQDGITSEALDLLLTATGYTRGAAFAFHDGSLELAAHRGLPSHLRPCIERLPIAEPIWFLTQVAMKARALVSAHVVSTAHAVEIGPAAFAAAGWAYSVACPISAGREIHGVIMLANPAALEPDDALKAAVEIACRLLALQIPRRAAERRSEGAVSSNLAALGVLTCGLAAELDDRLADIERGMARYEQLAARLKREGAAGLAFEVDAINKSAAAALRQSSDITARLLATFQSVFHAVPSPSSSSPGAAARGAPSSRRALPASPRSNPVVPNAPAEARPTMTEPATPAAIAQLRRNPRFDTLRSETATIAARAASKRDPRTAPTELALPLDGFAGHGGNGGLPPFEQGARKR